METELTTTERTMGDEVNPHCGHVKLEPIVFPLKIEKVKFKDVSEGSKSTVYSEWEHNLLIKQDYDIKAEKDVETEASSKRESFFFVCKRENKEIVHNLVRPASKECKDNKLLICKTEIKQEDNYFHDYNDVINQEAPYRKEKINYTEVEEDQDNFQSTLGNTADEISSRKVTKPKKNRNVMGKNAKTSAQKNKFIPKKFSRNVKKMDQGSQSYPCTVCEAVFSRISYLKQHRNIHEKQKSHICGICERGFTDPSNLNKHLRIHTGEKPYKCKVCSRGFSRSSHLKAHSRIHTGDKQYKCGICELSFFQKSLLNYHLKSHTGENPYQCEICNKGFRLYSHLKRHIMSHVGHKPYKCHPCGARFIQLSDLKVHIKIHFGKKCIKI